VKVRKKIKRPITRLWHIAVNWRPEIEIRVSKGPLRGSHGNPGCIRAKTAKAAGRRYLRNKLAHDLASADHETENPGSGSYGEMKPQWLKRYKSAVARAKIVVVK
jgi:hypothetical protein